ncbi:MAG: V-type ATPase subunit a family protein [Firmicutes bacterium]|nr:V-type ATPase subunit a family protein [Bacillota bacterium]
MFVASIILFVLLAIFLTFAHFKKKWSIFFNFIIVGFILGIFIYLIIVYDFSWTPLYLDSPKLIFSKELIFVLVPIGFLSVISLAFFQWYMFKKSSGMADLYFGICILLYILIIFVWICLTVNLGIQNYRTDGFM